jgi:hypothetical protein
MQLETKVHQAFVSQSRRFDNAESEWTMKRALWTRISRSLIGCSYAFDRPEEASKHLDHWRL